ncbi:serine/arginine repetitive matrix protein 1-like [Osmerus eperlanus]|uniref:serine/arginine repetitive matrix protein 1-like n=1 Tax=Osmerus eperlanus TaxID=29151 RepID=UPI002E0E2178
MDLSRSQMSSADLGLAKQLSWHNRLTRSCNPATNRPQNHPGTKPHPAPAHSHPDPAFRISSYGTRSRSLLSHRSPSPLPGISHSVGGGEAGAMPPGPGVDARLEGGVQCAVNGGIHPGSNRTLSQGVGPDPFRTGPRSGGGGGLWNPRSYDPDQSDSPSPESSGGEDSQSDSDVIYLVSTAQDDALVSQEDSASPCSSLDRDCTSSIERDCPIVDPLSHATASSLNEGLGCFLLPPSHRSPSPDSTYSDDSSYSTRDVLLHSKPVVHLSQLVYADCPGSPVDISSDDSDVMEVPVTNHKSGSDSLPPRLYVRRHQGEDAAPPRSLSSQPRAPQTWGLRRSPRAPKTASSPVHTPTRTVYSRGAKMHSRSLSLSMHSESYDSGDMMDSTERQSSSEEDDAWPQPAVSLAPESEDSDVGRRMVGEAPSDRHTPSTLPKLQRGLSLGSQARSQSSLPASPLEVHCKPLPPLSPSGSRKRLTKRKPCQSAPPSAKQPAKPPPANRAATPSKTASKTAIKTASKTKTPAARPRRKKHKPAFSGPPSCSLFSPQEPEIQLRYARTRERKEHKSDNFCPFIHVERRECTVVNYQEEEQGVRGGQPQGAAGSGSLSGLVPRTSCFKLGRICSRSRGESSQVCCLCGSSANTMGLGDLHGPYYPSGPGLGDQNHPRAQSQQQNHNKPAPDYRAHLPGAENGWHGPSNGHRPVDEAGEEESKIVVGSDGEGSVMPPDRPLWTGGSGAHSPRPGLEPPHSPGPEPQPTHSPLPTTELTHYPGPALEPSHYPGPALEPSHYPGLVPEPSHYPGLVPEPTHYPGPTPEPTHSPGPTPEPTHSPGPAPEPTHSPGPTLQPKHSPGPAPEPTQSPGPAPEPTHSPGLAPEPTQSPGPAPEPTHSPGPTLQPTHSPGPAPEPTQSPGERWVHEDCGVWSAGVFLVKGMLYGLDEAVRLARETVCTACGRPGATMGCFIKSCPTKYHYKCACQSGCALNEDNFSMRCPKHKNKTFQGVTRQCYR